MQIDVSASHLLLFDVRIRVNRITVYNNLKVKVRTCAVTRVTDTAYGLTA